MPGGPSEQGPSGFALPDGFRRVPSEGGPPGFGCFALWPPGFRCSALPGRLVGACSTGPGALFFLETAPISRFCETPAIGQETGLPTRAGASPSGKPVPSFLETPSLGHKTGFLVACDSGPQGSVDISFRGRSTPCVAWPTMSSASPEMEVQPGVLAWSLAVAQCHLQLVAADSVATRVPRMQLCAQKDRLQCRSKVASPLETCTSKESVLDVFTCYLRIRECAEVSQELYFSSTAAEKRKRGANLRAAR